MLDLGCLDETAGVKRGTGFWLHERLGCAAASLTGIDASPLVPDQGIDTGFSRIVRGDVTAFAREVAGQPDVIVAGELIEHLEHPVSFLRALRHAFPGRTLILSTPNATGFTNVALAALRRESNHPDHLTVFSYKTLLQSARRAGIEEVEIIPYAVAYSEAELRARGAVRMAVSVAERAVHLIERAVPLWSAGWILRASL